jgi:hypothetical protein
MNPRKVYKDQRHSPLRSGKYWLSLMVLGLLAAATAIWVGRHGQVPAQQQTAVTEVAKPIPTPAQKEIVDFHMIDLNRGWIRYADSAKMTEDGGVHWTETTPDKLDAAEGVNDALSWMRTKVPNPLTIHVQSREYTVKKSQFLTDRIGWASAADGAEPLSSLLVTADGGVTWQTEVTPELAAAMDAERGRLQHISQEAALYAGLATAKVAIQAEWTLLPDTAGPGDVVLVRRKEPGEVTWQGKTYKLQPFESGYFTYLPIGMQVKPGRYPIGDQFLTVKEKKFETQYLKVTQQMESMKQDTKRIQADQKKIDLARSKSQAEFLFTGNFVQPVEGILTTPFGYTRYVNGKYDSSHMAVDLAAKEGTPIKATNDGVVALADSLYLTGNSIYLDHGMGLFSQYAHLSELRVKTGDRVKQGDIIGLVGTTGFSTGPHLHFTFWAHNVPVNPNLFFNTTPFHWLLQK